MTRLLAHNTSISGLMVIERQRLGDTRGHLARLFCAEEMAAVGWTRPIAQINQTVTLNKGTLRGMHFQYPPHAEMKLIMCLRGAVLDVAVDLRQSSATFLHWHAETLSADNQRGMLIPEGFAHGFQTLTDDVELIYCHSTAYAPEHEGGLSPLDDRLAIPWPLPVSEISMRDRHHVAIGPGFEGVKI